VRDVEPQVLYQVCIWIVCHDHLCSAIDSAHETRQTSPSSKFEDRLASDESILPFFQVQSNRTASVPQVVTLAKLAYAPL
jgi:hypothetical protein